MSTDEHGWKGVGPGGTGAGMTGRLERDTMGEVLVPAGALYGAQTARAVANFRISGRGIGREMIRALGRIKRAAAEVNGELGLLDARRAEAIAAAAEDVARGEVDARVPVDVFQTGSGTSSNMNANEVIANRANLALGGKLGANEPVHPNDHVNLGQSSNDVFPSAIHVAAECLLAERLIPALERLRDDLEKARSDDVVKVGRTHLQDATPIRLGQVFRATAQVTAGLERLAAAREHLRELALGGTAVLHAGAHPAFGRRAAEKLATERLPFREAQPLRGAGGAGRGRAAQRRCARSRSVDQDRRRRPLARFRPPWAGRVASPAVQPGSSMMPGKVNRRSPSAADGVRAGRGNDAAIALAQYGRFELNTMLPLIARNLLEQVGLLAAATDNSPGCSPG